MSDLDYKLAKIVNTELKTEGYLAGNYKHDISEGKVEESDRIKLEPGENDIQAKQSCSDLDKYEGSDRIKSEPGENDIQGKQSYTVVDEIIGKGTTVEPNYRVKLEAAESNHVDIQPEESYCKVANEHIKKEVWFQQNHDISNTETEEDGNKTGKENEQIIEYKNYFEHEYKPNVYNLLETTLSAEKDCEEMDTPEEINIVNYKSILCENCRKDFPPTTLEMECIEEEERNSCSDEKLLKCYRCESVFPQDDHSVKTLRVKTFKCTFCISVFPKISALTRHLRIHTGEKPFKCTLCVRSFADSTGLKIHLTSHTGEKPFKCKFCVKMFSDSSTLKRHLRCHTGEKPFKCTVCEKTFADGSYLKVHLRRHSGEKPFKCTMCVMMFPTSMDLKRHFRSHSGEKPFKCTFCSKMYSTVTHLKNHIKTHDKTSS